VPLPGQFHFVVPNDFADAQFNFAGGVANEWTSEQQAFLINQSELEVMILLAYVLSNRVMQVENVSEDGGALLRFWCKECSHHVDSNFALPLQFIRFSGESSFTSRHYNQKQRLQLLLIHRATYLPLDCLC